MPKTQREQYVDKLAAYFAYKLKAALGDEALTVTPGTTVVNDLQELRTSFAVKFGDSGRTGFSDDLADVLDNVLPQLFGELPGPQRTPRTDYNAPQNGKMAIYLLGDPSELAALANQKDKDAFRAATVTPRSGPARRR